MKVEIGSKYRENLERVKDLARLTIGDSKDKSLKHILVNPDDNFKIIVEPWNLPAVCYECVKKIDDGVIVSIRYGKGIILEQGYFFHSCHLFE